MLFPPDPMKPGDHRRHKTHCKYYRDDQCKYYLTKCPGSQPCDAYDDGIPLLTFSDPCKAIVLQHLIECVKELKYKIAYDCLEGEVVRYQIIRTHRLTTDEIQKAEQEEREFESKKLIEEQKNQSYNDSLKIKCILASLFIITAPFCYLYYRSRQKRVTDERIQEIRASTIDEDLKTKVDNYKKELKDYQRKTEQNKDLTRDTKDHQYNTAIQAYEEGDFVKFKYAIIKSINWHNDKAVLFLLEKYEDGELGEIDEKTYNELYINLLLFSSYIGNKQSAEILAIVFEENEKIKQAFLKKSDIRRHHHKRLECTQNAD